METSYCNHSDRKRKNSVNGVAAVAVLVAYLPLSSASYGILGLVMLSGALAVWQVRYVLRPGLFAVWLLLVALLNARHGDAMMLSGVLLTLQEGCSRKTGESNLFLGNARNPNLSTRGALKRAQQLLGEEKAEIRIFYDPTQSRTSS